MLIVNRYSDGGKGALVMVWGVAKEAIKKGTRFVGIDEMKGRKSRGRNEKGLRMMERYRAQLENNSTYGVYELPLKFGGCDGVSHHLADTTARARPLEGDEWEKYIVPYLRTARRKPKGQIFRVRHRMT